MAEEGPARILFESAGATVEVCNFRHFWTSPGPRWFARASWKQCLFFLPQNALVKKVLSLNPALIHINDKAAAPAGWALRGNNIPVVQHLRSSYFSTLSPFNKWLSINMIRSFSDGSIAISEDETDGFETSRPEVIFNSVDLKAASKAWTRRVDIRAKHGIATQEFLVGFMSVVSPVRGILNFIEMAKLIALSGKQVAPNYKFIVVGTLPKEAQQMRNLSKNIERSGLSGRIIFTDFQSDSLGYLAAFDVLVVCNEHGVLGRPALEATAVGTPCIAFSGHSGKSRVLVDGLNAKIVDRGDVVALANAVVYLAENHESRAQMQENALAYAHENFSPQKNAQKVMALYKRLLNNRA